MAVKLKEYHEHMVDLGDDVRIEREFRARADEEHVVFERSKDGCHVPSVRKHAPGDHLWVVFQRVHTGAELDNDGKMTKRGRHPVLNNEEKPATTTDTHVWVPVFRGPEKEAWAAARKMVGEVTNG